MTLNDTELYLYMHIAYYENNNFKRSHEFEGELREHRRSQRRVERWTCEYSIHVGNSQKENPSVKKKLMK